MFKCALNIKYFTQLTRSLTPFGKKYGIFAKRSLRNCSDVHYHHEMFSEIIIPAQHRKFSSKHDIVYERACEETLESLTEFFEDLLEKHSTLASGDVSYNDGVLTVNLGKEFGIYVINRQSPNKQIWLSSPVSGPKRFDYVEDDQYWIYKHDGQTLHFLLKNEISRILQKEVDLSKCAYFKM